MTKCKTCQLSALCFETASPGNIGLARCNACGRYYVDVTEPDGDVKLRPLPIGWQCPRHHRVTFSSSVGIEADDLLTSNTFEDIACPVCGKEKLGEVYFLADLPHQKDWVF